MIPKSKSKYIGINLNAKLGVSKRNRRRVSDNLVVLSSESSPVKRRGSQEENDDDNEGMVKEETKSVWKNSKEQDVEQNQTASEEFPDLEDGVRTQISSKTRRVSGNDKSKENDSITDKLDDESMIDKRDHDYYHQEETIEKKDRAYMKSDHSSPRQRFHRDRYRQYDSRPRRVSRTEERRNWRSSTTQSTSSSSYDIIPKLSPNPTQEERVEQMRAIERDARERVERERVLTLRERSLSESSQHSQDHRRHSHSKSPSYHYSPKSPDPRSPSHSFSPYDQLMTKSDKFQLPPPYPTSTQQYQQKQRYLSSSHQQRPSEQQVSRPIMMPFPPRGEIYHIDWREDRKKSQGAKKLFDPSKNEFVNVSASSSVSSSSASAFVSKKRTKSSHKQKSKPSTIMKRYERRGGSIQDEKSKHGAGAKEVSSKNTRAKYGKRQTYKKDKKKKKCYRLIGSAKTERR